MTISLRWPLWDKPCLPRAYFETCPLSYNNHYETWPFWDMTFFLQQPLWDMTILRHDIFPTSTIMRHDHFETWHFSYIKHYETWPFWDMTFFLHHSLWDKTILRHIFLLLHNRIKKFFFLPLLVETVSFWDLIDFQQWPFETWSLCKSRPFETRPFRDMNNLQQ